MNISSSPNLFVRDLYARMLLTRLVDDCAWSLHTQGLIDYVASCHGHEAAQVGSAACIEVGTDFTLPCYRDLGVVLSIGMTPYEVFRNYLQTHQRRTDNSEHKGTETEKHQAMLHWGYHKRNTATGPIPIATQILHAAGIAFASKLRKVSAVTVAYCDDTATAEADFHEGLRFAALHQLPVVFVCEQNCVTFSNNTPSTPSCLQGMTLPEGLAYQRIDGSDIVAVYTAMHAAMQHAREHQGPILLDILVTRTLPPSIASSFSQVSPPYGEKIYTINENDPLERCQLFLEQQGVWESEWAYGLFLRLSSEVEQAMHDAVQDNCFEQDSAATNDVILDKFPQTASPDN